MQFGMYLQTFNELIDYGARFWILVRRPKRHIAIDMMVSVDYVQIITGIQQK